MRGTDPQGAVRGKPVKTTVSDKAAPCRRDKVIGNWEWEGEYKLWQKRPYEFGVKASAATTLHALKGRLQTRPAGCRESAPRP